MAATVAAYPSSAIAWRSTIVIFIVTAIAMADRMAIAMLIGPIKRDFGIGDFQASLLVGAAFTSFYVLFLVPIGWAADRFSRPRVLGVCLLLWSLATIACGFATGFAMLFVLRMLVGGGEAGMAPCSHGIIADSFPPHALAKPMAMQGIGFQVGSAIGVAAAGAILAAGSAGAFAAWPLVGAFAPWRIALTLIGLPGIAGLALIPLLHDPRRLRALPIGPRERLWPFMRDHAVLLTLVLLLAGLSAMALGCVTAWVPEFVQRVHGVPPFRTGAMLGTLLLVAAFAGQGVYAVVSDWLSARGVTDAVLRVGLLPVALAVPAAWFAFGVTGADRFFVALAVLLLCIAPCNAIVNTTVQLIAPPALRSRLSAIAILTISLLGFTFGPALVGALSQYVVGEAHLGTALQLTVTAAMAASFVLIVLLRPRLVRHLSVEGPRP